MNEEKQIISKYVVYPTDKTRNKEWRRIMINGIKTDYEMNINGVLRNTSRLNSHKGFISKAGYYRYLLSVKIDKRVNKIYLSKHRLLCCLFLPIPKKYKEMGYKQENLCINHKDGDKLNCDLTNLEWCTSLENQMHAIENGFKKPRGEDSYMHKYYEHDIFIVCNMLQSGKHPREISDYTGIPVSQIYQIAYGKTWKHVSSNYRFPNFENKQHEYKVNTDDIIHETCKLLTATNMSYSEISKKLNVSKSFVSNINACKRHVEICRLYDLPRKRIS